MDRVTYTNQYGGVSLDIEPAPGIDLKASIDGIGRKMKLKYFQYGGSDLLQTLRSESIRWDLGQGSMKIQDAHRALLGVEGDLSRVDFSAWGGKTDQTVGQIAAYLSHEWDGASSTATGGLRYDRSSVYGSK